MMAAGHMSVQLEPLLCVGLVRVHAVDNPL
jgi:hypothetical protein